MEGPFSEPCCTQQKQKHKPSKPPLQTRNDTQPPVNRCAGTMSLVSSIDAVEERKRSNKEVSVSYRQVRRDRVFNLCFICLIL